MQFVKLLKHACHIEFGKIIYKWQKCKILEVELSSPKISKVRKQEQKGENRTEISYLYKYPTPPPPFPPIRSQTQIGLSLEEFTYFYFQLPTFISAWINESLGYIIYWFTSESYRNREKVRYFRWNLFVCRSLLISSSLKNKLLSMSKQTHRDISV